MGEIQLVNFFSSWCGPCRTEHDFLMRINKSEIIPIYGINYKDKQNAAKAWLLDLGDPYERIGRDIDGRTAIDWGVYGRYALTVDDESRKMKGHMLGGDSEKDWRSASFLHNLRAEHANRQEPWHVMFQARLNKSPL